ncbi:Ubiquitin domain-containing protein 1 like [Verticillium longisporum]|nr:Ubiquitin domain-containing protein 1 like [Verticillium longisporum]
MGCCFSRPDGPNSPYPGGDDNNAASAHPINPAPTTSQHAAPYETPATATVNSRRRSRRENAPLDEHINKPLRRHAWTSTSRTWTRAALARERTDFFDTRVTGRAEVWETLHAALRVLWDPAAQGAADDGTNGLATAQGFLTAAEVTLPTGNLTNGVYDALGNYYPLPEWVVADPDNVAEDDTDAGADEARSSRGRDKEDLTGRDDTEDAHDEAARRREEKGKAVDDAQNRVTVLARISDTSRDVSVSLPDTKTIRIAYMGKLAKESTPLADLGWTRGHVVNAFVFERHAS